MSLHKLGSTILVLCFVGGCGRTPPAAVVSPDGSMEAVPDPSGPGGLTVTVRGTDGPVLYRWDTAASPHQWWEVRWEDERTLLLASGDIGAYTLERLPDGGWRESTPGGVFSPDGTQKVQTSWESAETRRLRVWFGDVRAPRSFAIRGDFRTDLVTVDPFRCARWDGNGRVVVTAEDGEQSWVRLPDGSWAREN